MKGRVFDTKARWKGVVTVVIDVPEEFFEALKPREEVEITKIKKINTNI